MYSGQKLMTEIRISRPSDGKPTQSLRKLYIGLYDIGLFAEFMFVWLLTYRLCKVATRTLLFPTLRTNLATLQYFCALFYIRS